MAYTLSQCVWFDLETTGLNPHKCQMTQICAVHNDKVFMRFVTPNCPIDPKASEITSIYYDKDTNVMTHRDQPVQHVSTELILQGLLDFLSTIDSPVLVAHNGKYFDFIILYRAVMSYNMLSTFKGSFDKFMDSLPLSRAVLSYYPSHKLNRIYKRMFKEEFPAHDAAEDAKALGRIVKGIYERSDMLELYYCSFNWATVMNTTFPKYQ